MAINFPVDRKQVINRIQTDVQAELPNSDPFLRNSWIKALIVGLGGRVYETWLGLKALILEAFPQTASALYLALWGNLRGLSPLAATQSSGNLTLVGTIATLIPINTSFRSSDNLLYTTSGSGTIALNTVNIATLTYAAGTATATCLQPHGLGSTMTVNVVNALQSEYNIAAYVYVIDAYTFSYPINGSPATPATPISMMTIQFNYYGVSVPLLSVDTGANTDIPVGSTLTLVTNISGLQNTAYIQFPGLTGGFNTETTSAFRERVLYAFQNPVAFFNKAQIINWVRSVSPAITRVWVVGPDDTSGNYNLTSITALNGIATVISDDPHGLIGGSYVTISGSTTPLFNLTNTPVIIIDNVTYAYACDISLSGAAPGTLVAQYQLVQPGQVLVTFTEDNSLSNIPSAADVNKVLNFLLSRKPAFMRTVNLMVISPTPIPTSFTFTDLVPNLPTMQTAITNNLTAFFRTQVQFGQNILEINYNNVIVNTIDPDTGLSVTSFSLSSPTTDITIGQLEIGTLGACTYP